MEIMLGLGSAFWIGILTSISPCPLATNIAAVSFISKTIDNKRSVLITGLLYTLGRIFTYSLLSLVIIKGLYLIPSISIFLQSNMQKILGPLLIVVGMFMLELISINLPSIANSTRLQNLFKNRGIWGAFPLGVIFALSFCPVSAALYFGSLIPLATKFSSTLLLPAAYGIGTGVPVFAFAILLAMGASRIEKAFKSIGKFEFWFRTIAGVIFIIVGIYFCLSYILEVF